MNKTHDILINKGGGKTYLYYVCVGGRGLFSLKWVYSDVLNIDLLFRPDYLHIDNHILGLCS